MLGIKRVTFAGNVQHIDPVDTRGPDTLNLASPPELVATCSCTLPSGSVRTALTVAPDTGPLFSSVTMTLAVRVAGPRFVRPPMLMSLEHTMVEALGSDGSVTTAFR